ncbi:hypothetical protein MSG28_000258 [Choristoneura fumiferana]|uniref:Uncharacterized protein n=1 Tax=Choristoneura fumiferana TaxID=7141 RepID=A0ACC0JZY9_CHOFU|nr:hypothetical protein MSG28_000258 [Choristoneura fumiferana]
MRRVIIPMLLLTAAALTNGVVLPLLRPLEASPSPSSLENENNHITQNAQTECEILKIFFCKNADWMNVNNQLKTWKMFGDPTDNNPEGIDYNDYMIHGVSDDYGSQKDPWIRFPRPFDRLQKALQNNYYDFLKDNAKEKSGKFGYFKKYPPLQSVNTEQLQNQDIPITNNEAVYATYVDPFDFFKFRLNRQYKNMAYQHLYYDNPSTEVDLGKPEERKNWDNSPLVEDVTVKRDGDSGPGQKEIPDNLVFNEDQKSAEQKKLFSFWSRLQSMSQKGRKLPTRRYAFVYYGPDGVRDGPLTAEIRASHLRPPGQPLRWG